MTQPQLPLPVDPSGPRRTPLETAALWFARMRAVVDAADFAPTVKPPSKTNHDPDHRQHLPRPRAN